MRTLNNYDKIFTLLPVAKEELAITALCFQYPDTERDPHSIFPACSFHLRKASQRQPLRPTNQTNDTDQFSKRETGSGGQYNNLEYFSSYQIPCRVSKLKNPGSKTFNTNKTRSSLVQISFCDKVSNYFVS